MSETRKGPTRREFIASAGGGIVASSVLSGFPSIVPASVLGASSPSNRINVGAIGTGRISRVHDLPGLWKYDSARIMAVCDLDSNRVADAKTLINGHYSKKTGKPYDGVTGYAQLPASCSPTRTSTPSSSARPDHWHALIAIARRPGRKGCLPAEAGVADHRRGSRAERRGAPLRPDLPDRQPAALDHRSSATRRSWCATAASAT